MKRRALKLLLFLLVGGAIINVAVAWGCACWGIVDDENVHRVPQLAQAIFSRRGISLPEGSNTSCAQVHGRGLSFTSAIAEAETTHIVVLTHAGWPMKSMAGELRVIHDLEKGLVSDIVAGTEISERVRARDPMFPLPFVLPFGLMWPGFAINTIFYAAVLWVLFAVPFKVRRWRRIKRGQCASCGYSLRGTPHTDKCPECGKPV